MITCSKRFNIITLIFLSVMIAFVSCIDEEESIKTPSLPKSVKDIVSTERLKDLENLGITINRGKTPPNIEGSYRVNPFKKINANFEDDYNDVLDYTYTFSEQDSKVFTVLVEELNNDKGTVGTGDGTVEAAISGSGNAFSVFVKIHTDYPDGAKSDMISVISGELTEEGIKNFQYASIMDNNYGNAKKYLMDAGQGRLWEDEDGMSLLKHFTTFQYTGTGFKYPERATVHGDETFDVEYRSYDEETYSTNFYYSDDYFNQPSTNNYNHELATMSLKLAMAAFGLNKDKNGKEIGWDDNKLGEKTFKRTSNIRALLGKGGMDFLYVKPMGYDHQPRNDKSIAVTFAHKSINGKEIIVIAVRGGLYEAEWGDNFRVGTNDKHEGFNNAKDIVIGFLDEYLTANSLKNKNVKFWITGYSRGAAVANLVAAEITQNTTKYITSKDDIYAYCFATPRNDTVAKREGFENIFNIINPTDPVPHFPFGHEDWGHSGDNTWGFNRYGITKYLAGPNESDFKTRQSNMLTKLNSLSNSFNDATYTIDTFRYHNGNIGLRGLYDAGDNFSNWTVQTYLSAEHGLIGLLHSVFGTTKAHTPQAYVDNYQDSAIAGASRFKDGKVIGFMGILGGLNDGDKLAVAANYRSAAATLGLRGDYDDSKPMIPYINDVMVHYNYLTLGDQFFDYWTQAEANAQCLEAQRNALAVSQGHFPELYLAWMMSGSDNCFISK